MMQISLAEKYSILQILKPSAAVKMCQSFKLKQCKEIIINLSNLKLQSTCCYMSEFFLHRITLLL